MDAPGENLARVTECHQISDHLYLFVCGTVKCVSARVFAGLAVLK